jgi:hypothetical protein
VLGRIIFADVLGGEHRRAIRGQAERKNTSRRILRRRVPLVDTRNVNTPAPGEQGGAGGRNEPAEGQQRTGDPNTGTHDEWIIDAPCTRGHRNSTEQRRIIAERKGRIMRLYMRQSLFSYGNG